MNPHWNIDFVFSRCHCPVWGQWFDHWVVSLGGLNLVEQMNGKWSLKACQCLLNDISLKRSPTPSVHTNTYTAVLLPFPKARELCSVRSNREGSTWRPASSGRQTWCRIHSAMNFAPFCNSAMHSLSYAWGTESLYLQLLKQNVILYFLLQRFLQE